MISVIVKSDRLIHRLSHHLYRDGYYCRSVMFSCTLVYVDGTLICMYITLEHSHNLTFSWCCRQSMQQCIPCLLFDIWWLSRACASIKHTFGQKCYRSCFSITMSVSLLDEKLFLMTIHLPSSSPTQLPQVIKFGWVTYQYHIIETMHNDAKAKRNCSKQNSNLPIFLFKAVDNLYLYIRFCVGMIHIKEWVWLLWKKTSK